MLTETDLGVAPTPKPEGEWSVDKALESISEGPELKSGSESPLPFFHLLERLKTTPREGWRRFGISRYFPPLPSLPLSLPTYSRLFYTVSTGIKVESPR